jgi:hypothetical protein
MRRPLLFILALLGVVGAGCHSFFAYGIRNAVEEPVDCADTTIDYGRYYHLAQEAWDQVTRADPGHHYSRDYARGFKRGYVYYLDVGDLARLPAVPPWCYRQPWDETPSGHQAIDEWHAGFRHGLEAGRASGLHQWVLMPSTGITIKEYPYVPIEPPAAPAPGPGPEELPRPRPIGPGEADQRPGEEPVGDKQAPGTGP